jgi:hypothetical protein
MFKTNISIFGYFCIKRPCLYIFSENESVTESLEAVQENGEETRVQEDSKSDVADDSKGKTTPDPVKSETIEDIKEEATHDEDSKEEPKKLRARATATSTSVIR